MKTVELSARVRHAVLIEGISVRAAADRFGINARTVSKVLKFSVPPGYVRTKAPFRPKLDGDHPALTIDHFHLGEPHQVTRTIDTFAFCGSGSWDQNTRGSTIGNRCDGSNAACAHASQHKPLRDETIGQEISQLIAVGTCHQVGKDCVAILAKGGTYQTPALAAARAPAAPDGEDEYEGRH